MIISTIFCPPYVHTAQTIIPTGFWDSKSTNKCLTKITCIVFSFLFFFSLWLHDYLSSQQALFLTYRWKANLMTWLFSPSFWVTEENQNKKRVSVRAREMHSVKKVNLIKSFTSSESCSILSALTYKALILRENATSYNQKGLIHLTQTLFHKTLSLWKLIQIYFSGAHNNVGF